MRQPSGPTLQFQLARNQPGTAIRWVVTDGSTRLRVDRCSTARVPDLIVPEGIYVRNVRVIDVLEHVVDEEAWLAAIRRAIPAGSSMILRVPVSGPLAWLDAANMFRYLQDVTGWGNPEPDEAMEGWHRHYSPAVLEDLLREAGFMVDRNRLGGSLTQEVADLVELIRNRREQEISPSRAIEEHRLFQPFNNGFRWRDPLRTRITVWATAT